MNIKEIYPWSHDLWQRVVAMRERLPHAILLHGRQGIGKLAFSEAFAAFLLCETPIAGSACGTCLSCGWLAQDNHPDFRMISPEEVIDGEVDTETATKTKKKSVITVDQIRTLNDMIGLSSHRQGLKIVLIHPVETLNTASANALLKMLEEPPPNIVFLLVSHQLQRLLPTIRSRCHKITMYRPTYQAALSWLHAQAMSDAEFCLAQAGGVPLLALENNEHTLKNEATLFLKHLAQAADIDPFAAAAHWGKEGLLAAVVLLQKWAYDIFSIRLANTARYHPGQLSTLAALAKRANMRRLLDFQKVLIRARTHAGHPLNAELQLEALLLGYSQLFSATD